MLANREERETHKRESLRRGQLGQRKKQPWPGRKREKGGKNGKSGGRQQNSNSQIHYFHTFPKK
jgi:hypothetical protein